MPLTVAVAKRGPLAIEWHSVISAETINNVVRILVEAAKPTKVILFGSYARGDARDDSDIDLLVVEPSVVSKRDEIVRLRRLLRPFRVPVDVIVVSDRKK